MVDPHGAQPRPVRHTRAGVVDAALRILDDQGLPDLTMRHLAAALDVQPSALYWHFPNKQTLLAAVADRIVTPALPAAPASPAEPANPATPAEPGAPAPPAEPATPAEPDTPAPPAAPAPPAKPAERGAPGPPAAPTPLATSDIPGEPGAPTTPAEPATPATPAEPGAPADQPIRAAAASLRAALLAHRDGAELVSSTEALGLGSGAALAALTAAVSRAGIDPRTSAMAATALLHFILGHVSHEQQRQQYRRLAAAAAGAPPAASPLPEEPITPEDEAFDFGITLLVAGLAATSRPDSRH